MVIVKNPKREESDYPIDNFDNIKNLQKSFKDLWEKEELFSKIIEFFPYPIQVYSAEGTVVMVNNAMLTEFGVVDKDMVIGKYNIFKDPEIVKCGLLKSVERALEGKTVHQTDLEVPLKSIRECYKLGSNDIDAIYQDATLFPVLDKSGKVSYLVLILITRRVYKGKESIIKAKEYFNTNWRDRFNIEEAAKAANLSPYHFLRLFKKDVGITPYNYYLNIKLEKIKEKLCDMALSISEVFDACGVDYNGHFAKLFKKSFGVTPSEFRKKIRD